MKNWLILFQISPHQYLFSRDNSRFFRFEQLGIVRCYGYLEGGGWLLGVSGYPLKEWLLTPFLSQATQQEVKYNVAHGKTRVIVEKSFGGIKIQI